MDTLVFGLILATFFSMAGGNSRLILGLFLGSLVACAALFSLHATDSLPLHF